MRNFKKITLGVFILLLLFIFQSVNYAEQITKSVTYSYKFAPLGEGIDWEKYIPGEDSPFSVHFKFELTPPTFEAETHADITFDQTEFMFSVQPKSFTDDVGNTFVGKFKSQGGIVIIGDIVVDLDTANVSPFLPSIKVKHRIPILENLRLIPPLRNILPKGLKNIKKNWNETEYSHSLLLEEDESIQLDVGIRNIFSEKDGINNPNEDSSFDVSVADLMVTAITSAASVLVSDKIIEVVSNFFGDAGFKLNLGIGTPLTFSGGGIYLDGLLSTSEEQTIDACGSGLNLTSDHYVLSTSYVGNLAMELNLLVSLDAFFKFSPLGITLWNYTKELAEKEFYIADKEFTLDFEAEDLTFELAKLEPIAQDFSRSQQRQQSQQRHLPEATKRRLGKGSIQGDISYSPDGNLLAVASSIGTWLYNVHTGEEVALLTGHTGDVLSVRFSPDGETLATAGSDATVRLWDVATRTPKAIFREHPAEVNSVAFSPDGKTLASGGSRRTGVEDGKINLWDVDTGTLKTTLTGHYFNVLSLAFSPDGNTIASGTYDGWELWDIETGTLKFQRTTGSSIGFVDSVTFSSDAKTLVSGGYETVQLWDVATGTQKATLPTGAEHVVFSPDNETLATASGLIRLWEVNTEKLIDTFDAPGSVLSISFSPNGGTLASAHEDGAVRVWEVNTGIQKEMFSGHSTYVERLFDHVDIKRISFSPDSKTLAKIHRYGTVQLWDVATGTQKATLPTGAEHVVFSPDSETLATGGGAFVQLWDIATGAEKATLHGADNNFAFTPDGKTIASVHNNNVKLWEVTTGECPLISTFSVKDEFYGGNYAVININSVAFSPDGATLAVVDNDTVLLLEGNTLAVKATLTGHRDTVNSVAFSSDRKRIATGSSDETVRVWDANTGRQIARFLGHTANVNSVVFSPDGKTLASGSDRYDSTVRLWDVNTETKIATLNHTDSISSMEFSPDGKTLVSLAEGEIRLWDTTTGTFISTLFQHSSVTSVHLSPDGKTLATASKDGTALLWDWDAIIGALKTTLTEHNDDVNSVAFSPDGNTIATGSWRTVQLWDANTGTQKETLQHDSDVKSVAFSPDGNTIATGSWRTVQLWDANTGTQKAILTGHNADVSSVAFSPDSKTLVSGSKDGTVRVWNVDTGTRKGTLSHVTIAVKSVAFSPDGNTLATGGEGKTPTFGKKVHNLRLWDTNTWREKATLTGHTDTVNNVAFSPDGKTIVTGSADNTVQLWDADTGTFKAILTKHSDSVNSVSFSPDGKMIATAGDDSTVRLWNADTWREKTRFTGHTDTVNSIAFSPNSETLASGSEDRTVRLWRITPAVSLAGDAPHLAVDLNGDGEINIQDLVAVAAALGKPGENGADVNADGNVNIQDLVAVAAALGQAAAAPSAIRHQAIGKLTAVDVQQWLIQAQQLDFTDPTTQRGILLLQHLLAVLTPQEMALLQNYPNPFNPETWIPYQLAKPAEVTLTIYAVDGRVIRTLALGHQPIGIYQGKNRAAYWDGRNGRGERVASGVYFYTITAGDFAATRKMMIQK